MTTFQTQSASGLRIKMIMLFMSGLFVVTWRCSSPSSLARQPKKLPYQSQSIMALVGDQIILVDLDGNGFTEIIHINKTIAPGQFGSKILIKTFEGRIVEQVNYAGRIIDHIFPLDTNHDGILELIVPYVRNDSLFVSGVNHQGEKLFHFFLIDGQPRLEDGGHFHWDPQVKGVYLQDLDHDGFEELITVITTGYARLPRGILVHSFRDGKLIGKKIVGSPPRDNYLHDFDGDGKLELLYFGTSPNNGANVGGFDDQHSYLIAFELNPAPEVSRWKEISSKYSYYVLYYEDMDGDNTKELLAWTESYAERGCNFKIVELDPLTLKEIKIRPFNKKLNSVAITNLDRDAGLEIVAIQSQKEIVVFDNNFEQMKSRRYPFNFSAIKTLPDADNDGLPELVVGDETGDFMLDAELRIKATFPEARCQGVVRRGDNLPPQLVLQHKDHFTLVQLNRNPFYLLNRYSKSVLFFIIAGLVLCSILSCSKVRRQNRLLKQLQAMTFDSDSRGLLLFDSNQKIHKMNATLQGWLGKAEPEPDGPQQLKDLFHRFPEILAFVNDSIQRATCRHEKTFVVQSGGQKQRLQVGLDPLPIKKRTPFWLASFSDRSTDDEKLQAQTWCKMAQKAAHDIKNPLSAITLTLQRLQMLDQDHSDQLSEKFDLYVTRIIERVESLRRISKNFMKFVNIESLNFVHTDLNQFLIETTNIIRAGLPPDIQLQVKSGDSLPMIKIDPDAIRSVIENLVSNAINALPDGGLITVSAQFLPGLTFPGNGQCPKDYVMIEVADTGIGIAAADREHLFEPDFTRTEGGNGLGLAYVKKTVDDHSGYIEVESEPGAGTAFSIYIPTI